MDENINSSTLTQATTAQQAGGFALRHHAQQLGVLGKIFGSRDNAPNNIAGVIVIISLLGIFFGPILNHSRNIPDSDIQKIFVSLVMAGLSFLGGAASGRASAKSE